MQSDGGKTTDAVASFRQIADLDPQLTASVEGKIVETYQGRQGIQDGSPRKPTRH